MKTLIMLCIYVTALFAHLQTKAQITFNFTAGATATGVPSNLTVSSITQNNNNGITTFIPATGTAPVSSGYIGASGAKNGNSSAKTGAINTATSTYVEVVLTPAPNYWINISTIEWGNSSLPTTGPNTLSIYSSIDSYTSAIAAATVAPNPNTWTLLTPSFTPLNGMAGVPVTLRIYASGGAGIPPSGAINWRIDDLVINASALTGTAGNLAKYINPTTLANSIITEYNDKIGVGITTPTYKLEVAGNFKTSLDANINGITVGKGAFNIIGNTAVGINALPLATASANTAVGYATLKSATSATRNTALGAYSLTNNTTGSYNTAVGYQSLASNITADRNTVVGYNAMSFNTTGGYNTGVGFGALSSNISGSNNTGIGYEPMFWISSGNNNVALGWHSGYDIATGSQNTFVGFNTGLGITTGNNNTILGSQVAGLAPDLSNTIILADGQGNKRLLIDLNGNAGLGTLTPQNKLEITQGTAGNSGLRFTNLTSSSTAAASSGKVLSVNSSGDVVLEIAPVGGGGAGDGSETKIVAGTPNVTISGSGTIPSPYSISVSSPASYWNISPIGSNNVINNNAGGIIIGSGITTLPPGYKLYVSDGILAEKVKVALKTGTNWADHVFSKGYNLKPLSEVEAFIKTNKHLPGIQSAETLVKEGGIDVARMFAQQMEKIEELTLYLLDLDKKLEKMEKENTALKSMLSTTNQK